MYQFSYADILADDAYDARTRERQALDQAAAMLLRAAETVPGSSEEVKAVDFTTDLWAFFIKDLAHPSNAMPDTLRASLMSIGLGVMAECKRVQAGETRELVALADICGIIRDGLK